MRLSISAIAGTQTNMGTGEVTIEAMNDSGERHVMRIAPQAVAQMIQALLTRPPSQPGQSQRWAPVLPLNGVRRVESANTSLLHLELLVGPDQAIAFGFPRTSLSVLQQAIGTWVLPEEKMN